MDASKFWDWRVHFRNSGFKGLSRILSGYYTWKTNSMKQTKLLKTKTRLTGKENSGDHSREYYQPKREKLEVACQNGTRFSVRQILGSQCSLNYHLQNIKHRLNHLDYINIIQIKNSITRTPMARLPWLIRTIFWGPRKFFRYLEKTYI